MALDPLLIEVLACPVDKGPLLWFEDEDVLYNPRLKKAYAVREGVPVLLVDEATDVGDAEHERLTAKAGTGGVPQTGRRSDSASAAEAQ
ncbi:MAG: Trm112 family protein [Acidimicrobiales bacterium]